MFKCGKCGQKFNKYDLMKCHSHSGGQVEKETKEKPEAKVTKEKTKQKETKERPEAKVTKEKTNRRRLKKGQKLK